MPNWMEELLELYSLEDLFEVLEIEPLRVLEILYEGGHVVPPTFLEKDDDFYRGTGEET